MRGPVMTKVIALIRLFNKEKPVEVETLLPFDPDLKVLIDLIIAKLHEAEGEDQKPIEWDGTVDEKVFDSLIFREISVDRRNKTQMIVYKWIRDEKMDQRRPRSFGEFGKYHITKNMIKEIIIDFNDSGFSEKDFGGRKKLEESILKVCPIVAQSGTQVDVDRTSHSSAIEFFEVKVKTEDLLVVKHFGGVS